MSVRYVQDPNTGDVHVVSPDGTATVCGLPLDGDAASGGFSPVDHAGPATCPDCKEAIDALLEAYQGAEFEKVE